MINYYQLGNVPSISSEKVSFKDIAVTALYCSSLLALPDNTLLEKNKMNSYTINDAISTVSCSLQNYFSSKEYNMLLIRIDEIHLLKKNWNGYDADVIPFNVINSARNFISYIKDLSKFVSIFPTARQSIQIEFETDNMYCEAEIFSDTRIEVYAEKDDFEYINKQVTSVEQASSNFRNLFNARINH